MIDNLEYYKVFYYVAGLGGVTRAAEELAVSQPAVSQAIRQLERQLGTDLFYRAARGVRLTGEGEVLYEYVKRGYEQIEQGVRKIREMQNLELGEIRIGASDMTLKYYLLPFLEQFHVSYPQIKVIVTNAPTPDTLALLEEGKIDFGVVSTPFEQGGKLKATPVREIEDVFVAGRRFLPYKNRTLDLQELSRLPLICLEQNTSTRSYLDGFLKQNCVAIRPEFELATSDMIVQFALRSLGVGSVVRDFAVEYLESGMLFELRFNQMIPKRQFCVVQNIRAPLSAASRKLLEMMKL